VLDCQHCLRSKLIHHSVTEKATHKVLGGEDAESELREATLKGKDSPNWVCTQQVRKGDRILIYFYQPTYAIVAAGHRRP